MNLLQYMLCLVAAQVLWSYPLRHSHPDSIQTRLLPMHLIIKSVEPSSASPLDSWQAAIELLGLGMKLMTECDM